MRNGIHGDNRDRGDRSWRSEGGPDAGDGPAPPRRQPVFTAPPVLIWTLAAMWGVFAILVIAPPQFVYRFDSLFALSPTRFLMGANAEGGLVGWLAPLVGHMFVHADLMHIGVNSLWFLAFGAPVVRRLTAAGQDAPAAIAMFRGPPAGAWPTFLFLAFFVLCGAGGALTFIAFNLREPAILVGASGGVSGLLGGLVLFLHRPGPAFARGYRPLAALTDPIVAMWIIVMIALNVGSGVFGVGVDEGGPNIAWEAHLGGFFTGLLTFPVFDRLARLGR